MMHLLEYDFLAILDIDTSRGSADFATLQVVAGSVVIVCFDAFNTGIVFPENTFFLLVEHRIALLYIKK